MTSIKLKSELPLDLGDDRILNVQQAAKLFGVSIATFRRQHQTGKVPRAVRVGDRRIGWRVRDLKSHLATHFA